MVTEHCATLTCKLNTAHLAHGKPYFANFRPISIDTVFPRIEIMSVVEVFGALQIRRVSLSNATFFGFYRELKRKTSDCFFLSFKAW